ncbi:CHAD domain-containing protein, partial [Mesorhizobium sp.]|uniref:CHAD domain-containing protein n=1 Tax=Mesorhizobium sp. TaxID=1871066 RepID=UPI0025B9F8B0
MANSRRRATSRSRDCTSAVSGLRACAPCCAWFVPETNRSARPRTNATSRCRRCLPARARRPLSSRPSTVWAPLFQMKPRPASSIPSASGWCCASTSSALRRAKKALDKASSRGEADDFHDLRKACKTHSMHLSLLGRLWPAPIKARRKAVDKLGERLGELHDVFVMRALLVAAGEPLGP